MSSVLVLRALGIGDLATAVPALRGLRAAHPAGVITLAAPAWLAPLVALTGAVDRQVDVAGLAPRPLPAADLAVNLHGRGPQSHRLLAAARPGRLLGFACPAAEQLDGPLWTIQEHEVSRWCRMLRWYGMPADPADLDLAPPDRPDGVPARATVLHVGAKSARRHWPVRRFARVARELAAAGHRVVVTGSAAELPRARQVTRSAGLPAGAVQAGRTDLARLLALVAHARLVISGDTGVAHLATAFRVPSVVLFGPQPPDWWGPPAGRPWHRALWHGDLWHGGPEHDGPGHGELGHGEPAGPHPALAAITAAEVLAAVDGVLAAGSGSARVPAVG